MGKMVCKKERSRTNALNVESSTVARFQGLRPQVRFTKMTPRDQISFGADE
jgi:hypothetical protein